MSEARNWCRDGVRGKDCYDYHGELKCPMYIPYLLARIDRLEEALRKYGRHDPRCPCWLTLEKKACTCGWDAVLTEEGRENG